MLSIVATTLPRDDDYEMEEGEEDQAIEEQE